MSEPWSVEEAASLLSTELRDSGVMSSLTIPRVIVELIRAVIAAEKESTS